MPYIEAGMAGAVGLVEGVTGRGFHSSKCHLNLTRSSHRYPLKPPKVPSKGAHIKPKSGRVQAPSPGVYVAVQPSRRNTGHP
jgi:hypothetical protein